MASSAPGSDAGEDVAHDAEYEDADATNAESAPVDAADDHAEGSTDSGSSSYMDPCSALPASDEPIPDGFPEGAKRLPALPPEVYVFRVPPPPEPLAWKSCGDGCREMETPWAEPGKGALWVYSTAGVVTGEPWLGMTQRLPGGLERIWWGPADGSAVDAIISRTVTSGLSDGLAAPRLLTTAGRVFVVHYHDKQTFVYGGQPADEPVCLMKKGGGSYGLMTAAYSNTRWALEADGNTPIVTGAWPVIPGKEDIQLITTPNGDEMHGVTSAGEWLLWSGFGLDERLRAWMWRQGSVPAMVCSEADPQVQCGAIGSDGSDIAWLRGRDFYTQGSVFYWKTVDLMKAVPPLLSPPLTGKKVRSVPTPTLLGWGLVSGGYWASSGWDPVTPSERYQYLVRLTDGRLWKVPRRGRPQGILFVTSSEVGVLEGVFGHPEWGSTIVRYEIAALGPGEPPDEGDAGP